MIDRDTIVRMASGALFGKPLVTNVYRAAIVEAIVAAALTDWRWCSADYASHDFEHPDGTRIEVKQTALRQSWVSPGPPRPSWDIKARTGYWLDGAKWIEQPGRNADIYVLALHARSDESADHREPGQWDFFVIGAAALPATQRLGLAGARALTTGVSVEELAQRVEAERHALHTNGMENP